MKRVKRRTMMVMVSEGCSSSLTSTGPVKAMLTCQGNADCAPEVKTYKAAQQVITTAYLKYQEEKEGK